MRILVLAVAGVVVAEAVGAQESLEEAVARARAAWVEHRVQALIAGSDTVRLQVPGLAESASIRPVQAARLLERYLEAAVEIRFTLKELRRLAGDHAYAEVTRVFAVRGTSEERTETVFLGFRLLDGTWRLREIRITP